jgi:hypothetical protein
VTEHEESKLTLTEQLAEMLANSKDSAEGKALRLRSIVSESAL